MTSLLSWGVMIKRCQSASLVWREESVFSWENNSTTVHHLQSGPGWDDRDGLKCNQRECGLNLRRRFDSRLSRHSSDTLTLIERHAIKQSIRNTLEQFSIWILEYYYTPRSLLCALLDSPSDVFTFLIIITRQVWIGAQPVFYDQNNHRCALIWRKNSN